MRSLLPLVILQTISVVQSWGGGEELPAERVLLPPFCRTHFTLMEIFHEAMHLGPRSCDLPPPLVFDLFNNSLGGVWSWYCVRYFNLLLQSKVTK